MSRFILRTLSIEKQPFNLKILMINTNFNIYYTPLTYSTF
jgi:hypothetical protein